MRSHCRMASGPPLVIALPVHGSARSAPLHHAPRRIGRHGHRAIKTILVVEDEAAIARLIRDYLERAGFTVLLAGDGDGALKMAQATKPALVVLDLGLPGRDGFDVTRELRRTSEVPIVVVTARGEETDRVVGLELGADDYVVKPFSPRELVARVRAVLRRTEHRQRPAEVIRVGRLEIDTTRMRVTVDDRPIELTATEFQLLTALAREPGRVFTRSQLLDAVHGVAFESYERAIDAHVKNIRRKLEPIPGAPRYLQTVHGSATASPSRGPEPDGRRTRARADGPPSLVA